MKIPVRHPDLFQYELLPRVVCSGVLTSFEARGLGAQTALVPGGKYRLYVMPREENISSVTLEISDFRRYPYLDVIASDDGYLHFEYLFSREQIYTLRLVRTDGGADHEEPELVLNDFRLFCAAPDLYARTPMRGNTHCHTMYSPDGHEDPYLAAARYRQAGFDYLAITDHHSIEGSVAAIREAKDIPSGLALYPGEEVHVPNPYIHAVNVGAIVEDGLGIDAYYHLHRDEIDAAVRKIASAYEASLPLRIEPMDFAWRKWIADIIHENGGVAILAHPFWEYEANNTRDDMFRYLAKEKIYDAAEIIHGQEPDCPDANMQIAFWNDLRAEGIFITPIGADDAHRRAFPWHYDSSFNEAYTVLFAADPSFEGFAEAVRGGWSAAVESYEDAPEHVTATYRLTKYTLFLLDQYFPRHDALCFEEGLMMRDCCLGSPEAGTELNMISGRVKRWTDSFFGRA